MYAIQSAKHALDHMIYMLKFAQEEKIDLIEAITRDIYQLQVQLHLDAVKEFIPASIGKHGINIESKIFLLKT